MSGMPHEDRAHADPAPRAPGPLAGVRVLELSQFIAGPICGCILADSGADVIKIEPPLGEDARRIGPFKNGDSLYYSTYNRNKRSITLNLKTEAGKLAFGRLVESSDVVLQNYRAGVMDRLGIGYEWAKEINPGISYVNISGFGADNPYAQLPAFDQVVQAMSGIMYLGGEPDGPPQKLSVSVADFVAGFHAAIGTLLTLMHRGPSNEERTVDVALFDSLAFMLETSVPGLAATGEMPARVGNGRPATVPGDTYPTTDGWIYLAATSDRLWRRLLPVLGPAAAEELAPYDTNDRRVQARQLVDRVITSWCESRSSAEAIHALEAAGVACAQVRTISSLLEDPHTLESGVFQEMDHPRLGQHLVPGTPLRLGGHRRPVERRAALLGEHTDEVLQEIGLTLEEISALREGSAFR